MKPVAYLVLLSIVVLISCESEKTIDYTSFHTDSLPSKAAEEDHLSERMAYYQVPGVSIAVVVDGKLKWAKGYGMAHTINGQKVNEHTLFQAGSISKPVAALAALKLMEEGKVDLDADVNTYLKGWKVPENDFTKEEKVTLRRLLSHTAGVTVHGFPGYRQNDSFPSIETVLNGQGNTSAILVDEIPGSLWRYSGGGYTIMEKLVEELSGLPFEAYMQQYILQPLGMENSTYQQPLPSSLHALASAAYNEQGNIIEGLWHNYPEQAAAGLWTTPTDLAKYCIEIHQILSGKSSGLISKPTVEKMLTRQQNDFGLGLSLVLEGDSLVFQHGGKNAGFTNRMFCYVHQGHALIIMTNGDKARELLEEIQRSIFNHYQWPSIQ